MHPSTNTLIILVIFAWICIRHSSALESVNSGKLSWWQKLAGIVALMCVVLIAVNPEFWALGLLGDTTFFDLFVLLMSIQLQMILVWAWGWSGALLSRGLRWTITPSPLRSYLMVAWMFCILANVILAAYRALRRMES